MGKQKEIDVSNKVIHLLKSRGFKINKYHAKTTKSIYLKLDYGVCGGIRISDHKGKKKYKYKFNLIKGYVGPKKINDRGYVRLYYNYNNTEELLNDVQNEKKSKMQKYGIKNYNSYMVLNSQDELYKKFKNVA